MVLKSIKKDKNIIRVTLSLSSSQSITKNRAIATKKLFSYLKEKKDIPKSITYTKKEDKRIKDDFLVTYFYTLKY